MLKRFLRRFERLEHAPVEMPVAQQGFKISKRFERLEISDKKIEIAITDKITELENAPQDVNYFFLCPYCGMENPVNAESCGFCKNSLQSRLAKGYQEKANLIKICSNCSAKNLQERRNCWVCGKDLFLGPGMVQKQAEAQNVISLNIDGKEYKSTDKDLPFEIAQLMAKIRKEGYSKELINEWLRARNTRIEEKQQGLELRVLSVRSALIWRIVGLFFLLIFIAFQLRACSTYFSRL